MLSREELDQIAAADEVCRGVHRREFIQRHNEIMALCDAAGILPMCEEMKRGLCDAETDSKCQRCHAGLRDIPIASVKAGINSVVSAFKQLSSVVQKSAVAPFKLLEVTAKKPFRALEKVQNLPIICWTKV